MVNNSYVRLLDAKNNERELCRFNLKEDGSTVTSVLFAELYKDGYELFTIPNVCLLACASCIVTMNTILCMSLLI